jgi:lysozyme
VTVSDAGRAFIEKWEGLRLAAYQDVGGVWTIGYGSTYPPVHAGMTITQAEADQRMRINLTGVEHAMNAALSVPVTQNMYDAICSLAFNVGSIAISHSTLLKLLNAGDKIGAARQFLAWSTIHGNKNQGLLNRRMAEMALFLSE